MNTLNTTPLRWRWIITLIVSLVSLAVAAWWFSRPENYPHGADSLVLTGFNVFIEAGPAAVMLTVSGLLGLALSWAASRGTTGTIVNAGIALQVLFFAFVVGDGSIVSVLGYLLGMSLPVVALMLLVLLCLRRNRVGIAVATVLAAVVLLGVVTGTAAAAAAVVGEYVGNVAAGLGVYWPYAVSSSLAALATAAWAWLGIGILPPRSERPEWILRRRRTITIIASLGLVPYGFARLTWLTPWPLGDVDAIMVGDIDLATRLQGSLFVLPSAMSVVLVLGLISRWGEVFPAWIPFVGGREVPVMAAVIPGGLVAAVITLSGPGIIIMSVNATNTVGAVTALIAFPFYLWGPALALAVYAYWLHRRQPSEQATIRPRDRAAR